MEFNYQYSIVEELKEKKGKFSASIVRGYYDTMEEAEEKLKTMEPKENGKLKIEKKLISTKIDWIKKWNL